MIAQKGIYVQEVRYSGFAGRLYGCSRLITSGTSYPAITGYIQYNIALFLMFLKAPITEIAESKFLSFRRRQPCAAQFSLRLLCAARVTAGRAPARVQLEGSQSGQFAARAGADERCGAAGSCGSVQRIGASAHRSIFACYFRLRHWCWQLRTFAANAARATPRRLGIERQSQCNLEFPGFVHVAVLLDSAFPVPLCVINPDFQRGIALPCGLLVDGLTSV